ncbi:MAG: hypothetical protein AAF616_05595 [Bacteroidota bacterium]
MKNLAMIFGVFLLLGCSSGKKQFEQGNYEAAVNKAVNRLRDSPGNRKAKETLKKAYPLASKVHMTRIKQLKNSNEDFKWDHITTSYASLNGLYDQITRCPACLSLLPKVKNYRSEYNNAAKLAAEERYQAGLEDLSQGDRISAKSAFHHFQRVQSLQRNYKDTPQKLEEARFNATLHVLLDQIPVHSRTLGLSHEFFQNRLQEELDRRVNEFVRFYSPVEASRLSLQEPDQIVVLQFDDFVVGQVYQKEATETIQRDSVIVGTTTVNDESYDVYGTVEAKFTTYAKYIDSRGLLDMKIYDARTNRVLFQRKMPGEFNWVSEWANYQGDKRALSKEQLKLSTLKAPPSPAPQFLFEQFCGPIYTQAVDQIRNFYRGF